MTHWTKFIKGAKRQPGQMNKTEAEYAQELHLRKLAGEVLEYWFEGITFRLAQDCRYTPDFVVMLADGTMECHECKGFWADDAKVKIKCAADKFPFRFIAIKKVPKKNGGGWERVEF